MSRIGQQAIELPSGVDVSVDGQHVTVSGPKGTLARTVHERMTVAVEDRTVTVNRADDERPH